MVVLTCRLLWHCPSMRWRGRFLYRTELTNLRYGRQYGTLTRATFTIEFGLTMLDISKLKISYPSSVSCLLMTQTKIVTYHFPNLIFQHYVFQVTVHLLMRRTPTERVFMPLKVA